MRAGGSSPRCWGKRREAPLAASARVFFLNTGQRSLSPREEPQQDPPGSTPHPEQPCSWLCLWPVSSAHLSSRDPGDLGHSLADDFPWWHVPRVATRTTSGILLQRVDPLRLPPQGCWQTPYFPSPTPLLVSLHSAHVLHLTASAGRAIREPFREPPGPWTPWVYRGTSLEGSTALCSFQHLLLNGFQLPTVTPIVPSQLYNMGMEAGVCLVTGVLDTLQRTVVVQTHTGNCQRSRGCALLVLSLNLQLCYWGAANHCRAAQSPLVAGEGSLLKGEGGCLATPLSSLAPFSENAHLSLWLPDSCWPQRGREWGEHSDGRGDIWWPQAVCGQGHRKERSSKSWDSGIRWTRVKVSSAAQQLWGPGARQQAQAPNASHLVGFCKAGVRCGGAQWALQKRAFPPPVRQVGETQASRQNPGSCVVLSALNTFNLQQHQLLVGHCAVVGILFCQVDAPQADVAEVFFAG